MQFSVVFALLFASAQAHSAGGIRGLADCSHYCIKESARKQADCGSGANDDACFCKHFEVVKADAMPCLNASCGKDFVRGKLVLRNTPPRVIDY